MMAWGSEILWIKDWTGIAQDISLCTFENEREWMETTTVPIHSLSSSNIQIPVFYHFPLSSIFLSRDLPERSDFHQSFTFFSTAENGPNGRIKAEWIMSEKSMKRKGKIKENRGKGLKNMRANREGYGSNYRFRISFLASLKSIREVRDAIFASSCKTLTNPYSTTVFGIKHRKKERRKRNNTNRIWMPKTRRRSVG